MLNEKLEEIKDSPINIDCKNGDEHEVKKINWTRRGYKFN